MERTLRLGRRQVLIGPFPPILHRKIRKYVKYSRIFLFCLDEKSLAQNCFARKKIDFCVGQGEKRRNTGYVFRAFSTKSGAKRSFLRWTYPYSARPKGARCFCADADNPGTMPAETKTEGVFFFVRLRPPPARDTLFSSDIKGGVSMLWGDGSDAAKAAARQALRRVLPLSWFICSARFAGSTACSKRASL